MVDCAWALVLLLEEDVYELCDVGDGDLRVAVDVALHASGGVVLLDEEHDALIGREGGFRLSVGEDEFRVADDEACARLHGVFCAVAFALRYDLLRALGADLQRRSSKECCEDVFYGLHKTKSVAFKFV